MKTFKYPLSIEGTEEQTRALIPELEKLGYRCPRVSDSFKPECPILLTDMRVVSGQLGYNQLPSTRGIVISASNSELVLALAACVEGDEFHAGEWVYSDEDSCDYKKGNLYKIDSFQTYGIHKCMTSNSHNAKGQPKNITYFRKATKQEILNHFNMKKIIGYKLKEDCRQYVKATCTIEGYISFGEDIRNCKPILLDYTDRKTAFEKLKKAGVLDLWFEPVYEQQVETITLRCEGGTFEVEVSSKGIYYRPEDRYLDVERIKQVVNIFEINVNGYKFTPSHVDSGCKKAVPVEDWKKVLEAYSRLK